MLLGISGQRFVGKRYGKFRGENGRELALRVGNYAHPKLRCLDSAGKDAHVLAATALISASNYLIALLPPVAILRPVAPGFQRVT